MLLKTANLQRLCEPYLDKGDKNKVLPDVTVGQKKKQYEAAAAAVNYVGPVQKEVGRIHNAVNQEDAVIAPPKQVVRVEGSIADKLKFFQEQSAQLQEAIAQKDKEKPNPRLVALKADLDGLNAPLEAARSSSEKASLARQHSEELNRSAAEDEMTAIDVEKRSLEEEKVTKENEEKAKGIQDSVDVMILAYELNAVEVNEFSKDAEIKHKKQTVLNKYKILQADSAGVAEGKLARATKEDRKILAADMLSDSTAALENARLSHKRSAESLEEAKQRRERAAKAKSDAEKHLKQATSDEAEADRILKDLDSRYQAIAAEIASLK